MYGNNNAKRNYFQIYVYLFFLANLRNAFDVIFTGTYIADVTGSNISCFIINSKQKKSRSAAKIQL